MDEFKCDSMQILGFFHYYHGAEPIPVKGLWKHQLKSFDQLCPTCSWLPSLLVQPLVCHRQCWILSRNLGWDKARSQSYEGLSQKPSLQLLWGHGSPPSWAVLYRFYIHSHPGGWEHKESSNTQQHHETGTLTPVGRWFWCPSAAALARSGLSGGSGVEPSPVSRLQCLGLKTSLRKAVRSV